jgi:hypothetical protein
LRLAPRDGRVEGTGRLPHVDVRGIPFGKLEPEIAEHRRRRPGQPAATGNLDREPRIQVDRVLDHDLVERAGA